MDLDAMEAAFAFSGISQATLEIQAFASGSTVQEWSWRFFRKRKPQSSLG
jgi:hypothetical protein